VRLFIGEEGSVSFIETASAPLQDFEARFWFQTKVFARPLTNDNTERQNPVTSPLGIWKEA